MERSSALAGDVGMKTSANTAMTISLTVDFSTLVAIKYTPSAAQMF